METLQTLGTALGLTALAGLNLYLTVFVTGLAIRLGWVQLAPGLEGLQVLADPVVLSVAGVLLALELIVDKCAGADSGWDALHTLIRPVGGALLGLTALGTVDPRLEIVGALLGGTIAFSTHATKAGTRLWVNTSPEPVTNVGVSLAENVLVLFGLWFVFAHPILALAVVSVFVAVFWYCFPKCYRFGRAHLTALWHRLRGRAAGNADGPARGLARWFARQPPGHEVVWVLPCFTGRWKATGRYVRGCLVATADERLFFVGVKNFRRRIRPVALRGARWQLVPGRWWDRLVLETAEGESVQWRVTRRYQPQAQAALTWLEHAAGAVGSGQIGAGI